MDKLDDLIKSLKLLQEDLGKNVNMSYAGEPNEAEPSAKCDHETMSVNKGGQWEIEKSTKGPENPHMGHSAFNMDHVKHITTLPDHRTAKDFAHSVVDKSSANPKNKAKLKQMINSSKDARHLAHGMSNHILAHPSENLKISRGS